MRRPALSSHWSLNFTVALYGFDTLKFNDQWLLNAGGADLVVVHAQAGIEQPLVVELQRVEAVQRHGVDLVVAGVAQRHGQVPQRAAVGVVQRGAPQAGGRAGGVGGLQRGGAGLGLFLGQFQAEGVAVAHAAGLGLAREFREVLQRLDVGHACIASAELIAIDDIALAVVGLGPKVVLFGLAVAQAVAELLGVGELVFHGGREQVALFLFVVAAGQAVPVVAAVAVGGTHHAAAAQAGRSRAAVQVGHAAIGNVVGLQVLPGQRDLGGRAHAEGHRGGNAPALVLGAAAAGNVGVVHHGVQAQARSFAQHAVGVDGGAPVAVRAQAHVAGDEVLVPGLLGHQVDGDRKSVV